MHSEKDGKRVNEKVYPNPDPRDEKPMYIGKRIRHDKKKNFEDKPLPWKYPNKNKKFMWRVAGDGIVDNIKAIDIELPVKDDNGSYLYLGKHYRKEKYNYDK